MMQTLNENELNAVSGGLDEAQKTYTAVLAAQAVLGMARLFSQKPAQGLLITHALISTLNVLAYVAIFEVSNWYFTSTKAPQVDITRN